MAKNTDVGYSNKTASSKTFTLTKLGELSNYSIVEDEAGVTLLANTTGSLENAERISIKAQTIPEVKVSQGVAYPAPVKQGVQFSVKVEEVYSTTDSTDPSYRIDEPIVATLTVKHNQSSTFSDEAVQTAIGRVLSILFCDDGTSRIPALQRLATRPSNN